jgi:hypothetical protein
MTDMPTWPIASTPLRPRFQRRHAEFSLNADWPKRGAEKAADEIVASLDDPAG